MERYELIRLRQEILMRLLLLTRNAYGDEITCISPASPAKAKLSSRWGVAPITWILGENVFPIYDLEIKWLDWLARMITIIAEINDAKSKYTPEEYHLLRVRYNTLMLDGYLLFLKTFNI